MALIIERHHSYSPPESVERVDAAHKTDVATAPIKKPQLAAPKNLLDIIYDLQIEEIQREENEFQMQKQDLEQIEFEIQKVQRQRIEKLKEATQREKEAGNWGAALKVFSWMGSMLAVITGVSMIATGVGALAGSLLVVGGVVTVANQIMEVTGVWQRNILPLLPGDNQQEKEAVLTWIQIGVTFMGVLLSGIGIISSGLTAAKEGMQAGSKLIGGVLMGAMGVTHLGKAFTDFYHLDAIGDLKQVELNLRKLRHDEAKSHENFESMMHQLKATYEQMSKILGLENEIHQVIQQGA